MNTWSSFLARPGHRTKLLLLGISAVTASLLFSAFMIWNEGRPGMQWHDPVLAMFTPVEASLVIGLLTNGTIAVAIIHIFRKPFETVYFFFAALSIITLRTITLYLVPLEPPVTIIPLSDPILETTFYGGNVLLKDLFFSGHTANLILVGLLSTHRLLKVAIHLTATIVGALLVMQHVHYFADVVAAPFFAFLAYKSAVWAGNSGLLRDAGHGRRTGAILRG